jgi:hypothetical protein
VSDLRDQIADQFIEAVDDVTGGLHNLTRSDLERAADNAADTLLARLAIAGEVPQRQPSVDAYGEESHTYLHGWGGYEVWIDKWNTTGGPSVCHGRRMDHSVVQAERAIELAAALIVAARDAIVGAG